MKKIAINGMGRTGRVMLRQWLSGDWPDIEIVAVNDVVSLDNLVYLLKYDSVHGRLPWPIESDGDRLTINGRTLQVCQQADPLELPWASLAIDTVIDSSGQFTEREQAARHLTAGARRVLIGAPGKGVDFTVVLGVNEDELDPERHQVVSNASCTTNSLLPPLKVLHDSFGLEAVTVTTVHAVTASQSVVDKPASKMHRGRAAGVSMIPTSTGADKAAVTVMPFLEGRISALAIRVPVPDGSLTDINARVGGSPSVAEVNGALRQAAEGSLKGILGYSEDELVSADILGERCSGLVHAQATRVTGSLVKLYVWYDNETGYACRCLDVVSRLM